MSNYTFASAYLGTKQSSLLTKEQFSELRKVNDENYVLKLHSFGYGLETKNHSLNELVNNEMIFLKKELCEILQNEQLVMMFLTKYDLVNVRSLFKKKLFQIDDDIFEAAGFIDEKVLKDAFLYDDYTHLIEPYKTLILKTNEQKFVSVSELVIYLQQTLQQLLFEKIKKSRDKCLLVYFQMSNDISNLLTLLRFRKMKLKDEDLEDHLLNYGTFEVSEIIKIAHVSDEEILNRYSNLYLSQFRRPLEEALKSHDYSLLEQRLLLFLIEELKTLEVNLKSSATIIKYVILKQIELVDLKRLYANRNILLVREINERK